MRNSRLGRYTSFLGTGLRFELRVSHFAERDGLLLLVTLGESIIAIGAGGTVLDPAFILAAVLGLVLTSALWWLYFARDDEVARDRMLTRPIPQQLRQALGGYFYGIVPMLFGIILLATGIHSSIDHLTGVLDTTVGVILHIDLGHVPLLFQSPRSMIGLM